MTTFSELRAKAQQIGRALSTAVRIPANLVAYTNDDNTVSVRVSGMTNKVWVLVYGDDARPEQAFNLGRVQARDGAPVWVVRDANGDLEITGLRAADGDEYYGSAAATMHVPDNLIGSLLNFEVPGRMLLPGRVRLSANGGMLVYVEAFTHPDGFFPGAEFDLASYVPTTVGTKRWVKLYFNPAAYDPATDNTGLNASSGDLFPVSTALGESELAEITLDTSYIPLAGVVLTYGDTAVRSTTPVADSRYWLRPLIQANFGDKVSNARLFATEQQSLTIAAGTAQISTGGVITLTSESGTTDTLDTLTIAGSLSDLVASNHTFEVWLFAVAGHTITLTNDRVSISADSFALSAGADVNITETTGIKLIRYGGYWSDAGFGGVLNGGMADLTSTQTLSNKRFTELALYGVPSGYAGSQKISDQAADTTTDDTPTTLFSVVVNEGESIILRCSIIAHQDDISDGAGGTLEIKARRASGGNVTIIGTVSSTFESDSTSSAAADVDTGTQTARIRITGVASETWYWVGSYEYHKVLTSS